MGTKQRCISIVVLCALCFQASWEVARSQANQTPAVVGTALDIPGVVKGGTKIERIKEGFNGLDDPIGLMDGTLVFSEPGARRLQGWTPGPFSPRYSSPSPMSRTASPRTSWAV